MSVPLTSENGSPKADFYWQLCDPDAPVGKSFRDGKNFGALVEAIEDLMANEEEHTPEGYISSGNISIYWSVRPLVEADRA
jgi:hypothetical protein